MLQLTSFVKVADRTGVVLGQCLKVLGARKRRVALLGGVLLVSVKRINVYRLSFAKARIQKKFQRGTLHRVMLLRSRVNFQRQTFTFVRFNENAALVVNKRRVPVSNRLFGPLIREFSLRWPWLGCISRCLV
jgi:large subunit ribosomal protein L14